MCTDIKNDNNGLTNCSGLDQATSSISGSWASSSHEEKMDDHRIKMLVDLMENSVSQSTRQTVEMTTSASSNAASTAEAAVAPPPPLAVSSVPNKKQKIIVTPTPSIAHKEHDSSSHDHPCRHSFLHPAAARPNSLVRQMLMDPRGLQPAGEAAPAAPMVMPMAPPPPMATSRLFFAQARHNGDDSSSCMSHTQQHGLIKPRLATASEFALHSLKYNKGPKSAMGQIRALADGLGDVPAVLCAISSTPPPRVEKTKSRMPQDTAAATAAAVLPKVASSPIETMTEESPSQLHTICCWNDHEDLATICANVLSRDPKAIVRRFKLIRSSTKPDPKSLFHQERQNYEPYTLPINLALFHQSNGQKNKIKLNFKVLQVLAEAGPEVLCMPDGGGSGSGATAATTSSLLIAIRHHPKNLKIVRLLLETNPQCIHVTDKRGNTPLHMACFYSTGTQASLEVIQELYRHDPTAIDQKNINGETPWTMIQRNSRLSSSPVADFLYACSKRRDQRKRNNNVAPSIVPATSSSSTKGADDDDDDDDSC